MFSQTEFKVFVAALALLILPGQLSAHEVYVDPADYVGQWRIDGAGPFQGPAGLNLPAGRYRIVTGEAYWDIDVDAGGYVTVPEPSTAQGGQGVVTFNTEGVAFDVGGYEGQWFVPGAELYGSGNRTVRIVPGTAGRYTWRAQWGHNKSSFDFFVDKDGNVSAQSIPLPDENGNLIERELYVAIEGHTIRLTTAPVTIDPDQYQGAINVSQIGYPALPNGSFSGPQSFTLPVGMRYEYRVGPTDVLEFDLLADGSVYSPALDSAVGGQNLLRLKNSVVTFDPQAFEGGFSLGMHLPGIEDPENLYWLLYGTQDWALVPGVHWRIGVGSNTYTEFLLDPGGNIVDITRPAAFEGIGGTLRFQNQTITVDPNGYEAGWHFSNWPASNNDVQPVTAVLVPDHDYNIWIHGATSPVAFSLSADAILSSNNDSAFSIEGSTLRFNSTLVGVDANGFQGSWTLPGLGLSNQPTAELGLVPGLDYRIYQTQPGSGTTAGVFSVFAPCAIEPNPLIVSEVTFSFTCDFAPPDADDDGVPDESDNCPFASNPDQVDQDADGQGDVCDNDLDGDGVGNAYDNCPALTNADQVDQDGDFIGDACDDDVDGDGVPEAGSEADNCPWTPNPDQADNDADGAGDACDADDDNDEVADPIDNCVFTANWDQADFDGDGRGDVCDADTDGDGVPNDVDRCDATPAGSPIDPEGCNGAQLIALTCPAEDFANQGRYVSCVAHAANAAVEQELLTSTEKSRFVSQAARDK